MSSAGDDVFGLSVFGLSVFGLSMAGTYGRIAPSPDTRTYRIKAMQQAAKSS
jgi:hypothetical protein